MSEPTALQSKFGNIYIGPTDPRRFSKARETFYCLVQIPQISNLQKCCLHVTKRTKFRFC